jgi:TolA-binding protein
MRLPKRLLVLCIIVLLMLLAGTTSSVVSLFRGQVDRARMAYLERENQSLTSLLEGQAEQLSRLKVEVERLKEFEQNLRVVSGMDSQAAPMVGTGQGRGARQELPKKR